jgi:hypothetical protein
VKLRALEAYFTKYCERAVPSDIFADGIKHPDGIERSFRRVGTLAEADGIWFLCPKCYVENNGPVGTHRCKIGFRGKATPGTYGCNKDGQPVLWDVVGGSGLDDLQLSPSYLIQGGCGWHGFVGSSGVPPGEAA